MRGWLWFVFYVIAFWKSWFYYGKTARKFVQSFFVINFRSLIYALQLKWYGEDLSRWHRSKQCIFLVLSWHRLYFEYVTWKFMFTCYFSFATSFGVSNARNLKLNLEVSNYATNEELMDEVFFLVFCFWVLTFIMFEKEIKAARFQVDMTSFMNRSSENLLLFTNNARHVILVRPKIIL